MSSLWKIASISILFVVTAACTGQPVRTASSSHRPSSRKPASQESQEFIAKVFAGNLGADVEGGGKIVLDGTRMEDSLKKYLSRDPEHCQQGTAGWYLAEEQSFKMPNGRDARVKTLQNYICQEADQTFDDSIVLFYPGQGPKWLLITDMFTAIDFMKGYAFSNSESSMDSVVLVGHTHPMGGGFDLAKLVKISNPDKLDSSTSLRKIGD